MGDSRKERSMDELSIYLFEGHKVRLAGTPENPLFCAADVCAVLDIENSRQAVSRLRDSEKTTVASNDSSRKYGKNGNLSPGAKCALYVTEPGLYKLIFSSRKAEAERFQDWVTREVLPEIRKRGAYSIVAASERRFVLNTFFRELPEKQATLFNPLIEEMRRIARNSMGGSGGTPPWARRVAQLIYEWSWREHKDELRKHNPKQGDGSLIWRDYETLTSEGRRWVSHTIGMAVFAARESNSWDEWRARMDAYYANQYQHRLGFVPVPKRLNGRHAEA